MRSPAFCLVINEVTNWLESGATAVKRYLFGVILDIQHGFFTLYFS